MCDFIRPNAIGIHENNGANSLARKNPEIRVDPRVTSPVTPGSFIADLGGARVPRQTLNSLARDELSCLQLLHCLWLENADFPKGAVVEVSAGIAGELNQTRSQKTVGEVRVIVQAVWLKTWT